MGQEDNYNNLCPIINGKPAPTGCAATAVAQIMYHYGYSYTYNGFYYDWNLMKYYASGADMIYQLFVDLGSSENLAMRYGEKESSASAENVPRTFRNFGYSSGGTLQDYNTDKLLTELIMYWRPVYVRGDAIKTQHKVLGIVMSNSYSGGHAWVVDAMLQRRREVMVYINGKYDRTYTDSEILVHCNWGWNGDFNGYYYGGVFDTNKGPVLTRSSSDESNGQEGYYQYRLQMITGITR